MNNKSILINQINELLDQKISDGEIQLLSKKDIPLISQIASNFNFSTDTTNTSELIFIAAPTGAGKDTLVRKITSNNKDKNYAILNMDMFRHYYSSIFTDSEPLHDKDFANNTNQISYEIYYLIEELILNYYPGTNVILTGTMKNTSWIESILRKYKNKKYNINLVTLAVPYIESAISIFERYLNIAKTQLESKKNDTSPIRFTSMEYHDESFNGFLESFKYFESNINNPDNHLIDSLSVYKRNSNILDLAEDTLLFSSKNQNDISAFSIINSILNDNNYKIDSKRITDLLSIVSEHSDYFKKQNIYNDIIVSLYNLNLKSKQSSKEDINFEL